MVGGVWGGGCSQNADFLLSFSPISTQSVFSREQVEGPTDPLPPLHLSSWQPVDILESVVFSSFSVLLERENLTPAPCFFFNKTNLKKIFFPQSRPPAISEIVNRSQCQGISGRF